MTEKSPYETAMDNGLVIDEVLSNITRAFMRQMEHYVLARLAQIHDDELLCVHDSVDLTTWEPDAIELKSSNTFKSELIVTSHAIGKDEQCTQLLKPFERAVQYRKPSAEELFHAP